VNWLPFPFYLPGATALYTSLYLLTFVLHHAFMHVVVAGCLLTVWRSFAARNDTPALLADPVIRVLRDWMPFCLSAAITFGVAPLLFVQILFPKHFYTANLLLGWRWMMVIPVLIAAFYLLYFLKSSLFDRSSWWMRCLVSGVASGLFLFIGFCWTANHLVSTQTGTWPEVFASGHLQLPWLEIVLRTLTWLAVGFASMATIVAIGIRFLREGTATDEDVLKIGWLSQLALPGLAVGGIVGFAFLLSTESSWIAINSGSGYLFVTIWLLCAAGQAYSWIIDSSTSNSMVIGRTVLLLGLLYCMASIRELIRMNRIEYHLTLPHHQQAAEIPGLLLFLVTAVFVVALMSVAVRWVWLSYESPSKHSA